MKVPLVDSDAGIGQRHLHKPPGFHPVGLNVTLIERQVLRDEVEIASLRHGLPGIDIEVEQYLLDLAPVDLHGPEVQRQLAVDPDFLAGAGKHGGGFFDDVVEVGRLDVVFSAARKTQQLSGELSAAVHILFDVFDLFAPRMAAFEPYFKEGGVALDPHEDIVEVVGDTAR